MKKVLIMNDYLIGGGVEKVLYDIVNFMSKGEYEITLVSFYPNELILKEIYPSNIKYQCIYKAAEKNPCKNNILRNCFYRIRKVIWKVVAERKISKQKYDIVLALKEGAVTDFLKNVKAKYKYTWVHVDYRLFHWTSSIYKTNQAEINCMKKYNNVLCVSNAAKESVSQTIGDPGNLIVRMNPINVQEILDKSKLKIEMLEQYRYDRNQLIFVAVGGLREQKGYMRLLECCNRLKQEYNFELWIVGKGVERKKMEKYIQENKLNNIKLWGFQDNPYPFIKRADWFINSSFWESYGLAVQEARILDTPIIATTCQAFEECATEGTVLVDNSINGLYEGMKDILDGKIKIDLKKMDKQDLERTLYYERLREIEKLWE